MTWLSRGLIGFLIMAGSSTLALQQSAKSVSDGVYTAQQATRGQAVYGERCASCHAPTLAGRTGPPLVGDDFLAHWGTQPLIELANRSSARCRGSKMSD